MAYMLMEPVDLGGVSPDVVGAHIERLRKQHNGICPSAAYVEAARPESSPIHATLPWDKKDEVFEAHLREIAGRIVQVVVLKSNNGPTYRNVFVKREVEGKAEQGSVEARVVERRPDWRTQVARAQVVLLRGIIRNHSWLTEFEPILGILDEIEAKLSEGERQPVAA